MFIPSGFKFGSTACGIKSTGNDLGVIVSDNNCVAAGVYTNNIVRASCIDQNKTKTPSAEFRAVVVNSGNANACTGKLGESNSKAIAEKAAIQLGCSADQILVLSTGVIGQQLPMTNINQGIESAVASLSSAPEAITSLANAFMTTDRFQKLVFREFELDGKPYQLLGIAKGAGMIGPNMATMLAVFVTDAPLSASQAQRLLATAANRSFNRISVDGHTSTNDAVLLLAPDCAAQALQHGAESRLQETLDLAAIDLAKMIPSDGEGAAHLVEVKILGAETESDADQVARVVAASNLVKTAISGCDPNWGRIVSAAGYAGVPMNPQEISLSLNGKPIFVDGTPIEYDENAISQSMVDDNEVSIELSIGRGSASAVHWTSDLTADYVRLNADYRT